jgi:hypothetical protein
VPREGGVVVNLNRGREVLALCLCSALLCAIGAPRLVSAQESPDVQHQAAYCTVPDHPIRICAVIQDDGEVVKARAYFRAEGREYFSIVDMELLEDEYCATLPAPRAGKMRALEYYIQAIDDDYLPQRTVPFVLELQEPEVCGFPPVESDPARAASITVLATNPRQGDELDDRFVREGVRFVPKR